MISKKEAVSFVELLQKLYLEQRDIHAVLALLDHNITWIGSGGQELFQGLSQAGFLLEKELEAYPAPFTIIASHYQPQRLSPDSCMVSGRLQVRSANPAIADLVVRVTAVCVIKEGKIKLLHLHLSHPDIALDTSNFYRKKKLADCRETVKKTAQALCSREQELSALTENIPGGVVLCLADRAFTILNISDSFMKLFGYTREELKMVFDSSFVKMIYPHDRERVLRLIEAQLQKGDTVELEYRMRCKDGTLLWILDKGKAETLPDGQKCYYCIMLDITNQKWEREQLRLTLERHQVIMDQTTDIIFEWDILSDTLSLSKNWGKIFGSEPIRHQIRQRISQSENIHQEDLEAIINLMKETAAGVPYSEVEFRIRDAIGNYTWCRIRVTTQFSDGRPVKAIGVIINIQEEKKQKLKLMEQAQKDPLTGLLNKAVVKQRVEELIVEHQDSTGVLLLIDLDHFKSFNDRYGHLCGDAVLADTAHTLKERLCSTDVLGRIGGDEFLVFLPGVTGKRAEEIANLLIGDLQSVSVSGGSHGIGCSIGSAFYPEDGTDFYTLYRLADRALYHVKSKGKGAYSAYCEGIIGDGLQPLEQHAVAGSVIESDLDPVDMHLAQYSFRLLYKADDIPGTIQKMLEIIGRAYDVSRVYIFEDTEDGLYTKNTYEWCAEGITPEISNLQHINYQNELPGVLDAFDENGVYYCRDIRKASPQLYSFLAPQGICSLLHITIYDGNVRKGIMGFDECRGNRSWTQSQVNSLMLTANVISCFLTKLRYQERLLTWEKNE